MSRLRDYLHSSGPMRDFQVANAVGWTLQAIPAFWLHWVDSTRYISFISIWALVLSSLAGVAATTSDRAERRRTDQLIDRLIQRTQLEPDREEAQ